MNQLHVSVYKKNTYAKGVLMVSYILYDDEVRIIKSSEYFTVGFTLKQAGMDIVNKLKPDSYRIKYHVGDATTKIIYKKD